MFHFGLIPLIVLISAPLTSGLVYHCDFEDPVRPYGERGNVHTLSFTKQLPASKTLFHVCIVTTDNSDSLLQVKARTLGQTNGSLHITILDSRPATIGELDIFANGPEETVILCPQASGREYHVHLSGTPNIRYTAAVTDKLVEISLNTPVSFQASKKTTLFSFEPTFSVTQKQLDITVSSHSDAVAHLKVSPICKQAKNTKLLDYSGSYLRLTFNKKGRITLSRASRPSLDSSGFTYIGIALEDQSYENLTKSVKLTLTSSFDYNYSGPLLFLICVSLFGGIFVSLWACFCFRDQQRAPLPCTEILKAMIKVFFDTWVAPRPKTFSYTTCIVGFVLMIGAFQFVFGAWSGMIESGDRDRCYYNDFCYRVSDYDIPFNLMISNLVYMIHGLILACFVWVMEAMLFANCHNRARHDRSRPTLPEGQVELPKHCIECPCIDAHLTNMSVPSSELDEETNILLDAEAYKRKYTFSIGYSLAWALTFEGCFSTVYHFCPTQLTFQFDLAFMSVISGLIVISLYNGTSFKECTVHGKVQVPVHSKNFFLYFIVPLYIFNYFGSLYASDEISSGVTLFIIFVVAFYLILAAWVAVKLFGRYRQRRVAPAAGEQPQPNQEDHPDVTEKPVLLFIMVFSVTLNVLLIFLFKKNFPKIFLFGCIITALLAIIGKVIVQFRRSGLTCCTRSFEWKLVFQVSYVVVTVVMWGIALWIFSAKATTNKEKSPSESRDRNHDCVLLGFFDYHDLWHILSSFAILMSAPCVLYISK
ncbi:uncharacterized protein [Acropora muricata]|uniref:uncharacterized protein n=1 Tax=Acropora muricata TaxID=159855 RepID=UPI0034E432F1